MPTGYGSVLDSKCGSVFRTQNECIRFSSQKHSFREKKDEIKNIRHNSVVIHMNFCKHLREKTQILIAHWHGGILVEAGEGGGGYARSKIVTFKHPILPLAVLVRVKGTVPFQAWKVLPDLT